jgi:SAM-dependent methyltransferase
MPTTQLLVCPETLGPLEPHDDGWWSPRAQRLYPVHEGLVFMGYPESDAAMIAETMQEEREWQGTAASVDRDREFLTASAPLAVDLINLATRLLAPSGSAKALELGSGSGWVSWLLAEAGYDTWLCDFEANSLAIGQIYDHPRMHDRVVTDARYCPFPDATFDLVLMKEFVHHVEDFETLFREAQRVLRPGGLMVVMEPIRSVSTTLYELRHPDPHEGHHITWIDRYRRAIKRAGMNLRYETAAYDDFIYPPPRTTIIRRARRRAERETRGMARLSPFAQLQLRLFGGASIVLIGEKTHSTPALPRPRMRLIEPTTHQVTPGERAAFSDFPDVLQRAAERLTPIAGAVTAPQSSA